MTRPIVARPDHALTPAPAAVSIRTIAVATHIASLGLR